MKSLKDLFSGKTLPEFSLELKEKEIFTEIILCYGLMNNPQKILSYLILEYRIEDKYLKEFNSNLDSVKKAQEFFAQRKINDTTKAMNDLNSELQPKGNKSHKKVKL
jgi:hypothetical protein